MILKNCTNLIWVGCHSPLESIIPCIWFCFLLLFALRWNHLVLRSPHFSQFSRDLCLQNISSLRSSVSSFRSRSWIILKLRGGVLPYCPLIWSLISLIWIFSSKFCHLPQPLNVAAHLSSERCSRIPESLQGFQSAEPLMMALHSSRRVQYSFDRNCLTRFLLKAFTCGSRCNRMGQWSDLAQPLFWTLFSRNNSKKLLLARKRSILVNTWFSDSLLLHHMKVLPWQRKSCRRQSSNTFWKASISLWSLQGPPAFSEAHNISLKSPPKTHAYHHYYICTWRRSFHIVCLIVWSGWPYTPVNLHLFSCHTMCRMNVMNWKMKNCNINLFLPEETQTTTKTHSINNKTTKVVQLEL